MEKFSARRRLGNVGEDIACQYLEQQGFRITGRNYLQKWGEIDIIAERGQGVHFVEVKAISREIPPTGISREIEYRPEELVTAEKLRKIARTAELYMDERRDHREYQIDVVGVIMDAARRRAHCRLFEQVIGDELS